MIRIYDAEFEDNFGKEHWHLAKFWWVDNDNHSNIGHWTREQAHEFVRTHTEGTVYVSEGGKTVKVYAYHNKNGTKWIQTEADGVLKDNLTTLAERHRQGLPNR